MPDLSVDDFDFDLPDAAIALRPAAPRDQARLLQIGPDGGFSDLHVFDLPKCLRAGDVLVLNETKVLPAALKGMRPARAIGGGGPAAIELNLLSQLGDNSWQAFARPAKRLRLGDVVTISDELFCKVTGKGAGGEVTLEFNVSGEALPRAIKAAGAPPLPPYIARQRAVDGRDIDDYQTIFARHEGSVAAPTAGLHFTDGLLQALKKRGVEIEKLTLHVGAGTFLPVKSDDLAGHVMHSEQYFIDAPMAARLNAAKDEGQRIIAVGTTSLRALESAAVDKRLAPVSAATDIFIKPGYDFQIIDGLMTNFHLPRSTLFMLVSALAGLNVMRVAYTHAIDKGYRFYSYGDASLIWKAA